MRSLTKCIFLVVTIFNLGAQAHEGFIDNATSSAPKQLLDSAVVSLAAAKRISSADVKNGYQIEWAFKIEYNDDQPILFLFSNKQEVCLLEMGSISLITSSVNCR